MNDGFLNLLGIARRGGRLSLGHDAVISSIVKNSAKLCLVAEDGSERLKRELSHACSYDNKDIPIIFLKYTTVQLSGAIGQKAAVVSVNDEGFAKALKEKYTG